MAMRHRDIRDYWCDRCGDSREVEGNAPAPEGWVSIAFGSAVAPFGIADESKVLLLCADCIGWLRKFLAGRKVTE